MLYISWARLRCIKAPKSFDKELLLRKPIIIMIFIWLMGLGIWTTTSFLFGTIDFTTDVKFRPYSLKLGFNIVTWLIPLLAILVVSVYVIYLLLVRHTSQIMMSKGTKNTERSLFSFGYSGSANQSSMQPVNAQTPTLTQRYIRRFKHFHMSAQIKLSIIVASYWIQWVCWYFSFNNFHKNCHLNFKYLF
jgi:hypothetical protein